MSVIAPRAAPLSINWHVSKTETLPMYFGFAEKKPMLFEHLNVHRLSLKRLEEEFYILRNSSFVAVTKEPSLSSPSESKRSDADDLKYSKDYKADDYVTKDAYDGEPAVLVPSAKSMTGNLTFDRVDEPVVVAEASVDLPVPSTHSKDEAASPLAAKEEEEAAPAAEKVEAEGFPVPIPVAEPVDPALKAELHPERADEEERAEEERSAAVAAVQSGHSLAPLHSALVTQAEQAEKAHEHDMAAIVVPVAEPVQTTTAAPSSSTLHAPHPSLDVSGAAFPAMDDMSANAPMAPITVEALRAEEAAEMAAAQRESERLEANVELSDAEREEAEMALMSRTQRLAALHEKIIREEKAAAQPIDTSAIKRSPALPASAPSGKIADLQQLHLAQQAASGETHTVVEKAEKSVAPQVGRGTIAERKRAYEQKMKDEAEAKSKQDALFAGKYLKSGGKGGRS